MLFRVLTIFPELIDQYLDTGVLGRARKQKLIKVEARDLRDWTDDKHKSVDDTPYGGGAGMVMKAEPIYKALTQLGKKSRFKKGRHKTVILSASGTPWNQAKAREYAKLDAVTFICGRYEGIDERVSVLVDEELSLGDFVLTGGELGALAVIDSVARLLPGVLGNQDSLSFESHSAPGVLEYPQYTKPEIVVMNKKKYRVPAVLLSGNHKEIEKWRLANLGARPSKAGRSRRRSVSPVKKTHKKRS